MVISNLVEMLLVKITIFTLMPSVPSQFCPEKLYIIDRIESEIVYLAR